MKKDIILKAENISKQYRLGQVGTGTLSHDLNRWWHQVRGKENPYLKIGDTNDRSTKGESDYVWALQDINFEVERGEVLGIIGKNGAGKSTLLKILSRVTAPTTGKIQFGGRVASLLEVGTGFNGEMTGRENIYLNGAILGMTKKEIDSKIDEIIDFSGCERYIDTPVKRYSSGMTVRLAFAVAAFLEPEILIIDEVLAVGDAEFQKKAIGKMQDISREGGRTVLFVSHNMAAVQSLCTRGIVLENGKVAFDGHIDAAIENYLINNQVSVSKELLKIKDRSGSKDVLFSKFSVLDSQGILVDRILTGEDISFLFELKVNRPVGKINIGFSFHDKHDSIISYDYSGFHNVYFKSMEGSLFAKIQIKKFPFSIKQIIVRGRIEVDGIEADWPKDPIGELQIEMGNFYNTGKITDISVPTLINGKWNVKEN